MELTTQQVADKLSCTKAMVKRLVEEGKLTNHNKKDGVAKVFMRFDSKEVNTFLKDNGPVGKRGNGHQPNVSRSRRAAVEQAEVVTSSAPAEGIRTQLNRIEAKLDRALALWS